MNQWRFEDRYGNPIYMTEERWEHILESRPELEPHFDKFVATIKDGKRKQDPLIPNKYRYFRDFSELLPDNSHIY